MLDGDLELRAKLLGFTDQDIKEIRESQLKPCFICEIAGKHKCAPICNRMRKRNEI